MQGQLVAHLFDELVVLFHALIGRRLADPIIDGCGRKIVVEIAPEQG